MTALDQQRTIVGGASSTWAVVPTRASGQPQWWLVGDDNESERRGREVVNAFFGPAVAKILPQDANGEPTLSGVRNVRLDVLGCLTDFLAALELMTSVRASTPSVRREIADPIGFLVRDFYLALDRGDPDASAELLSRIEGTGLVANENLRFLRVDRLARLGYWRELEALPWFEDLARARRPIRISEQLLHAVWILNFDDATVATNPESASQIYESADIATRFGSLLRSVDVPASAPGRRLVTLFAHLSGDGARVDRIVNAAPEQERGLLHLLAGRISAAPVARPRSTLDAGRDLFEEGDYEGVVALAEVEPGPPMVAMAVRAAFEQNDPRLAIRVVPLLDEVDAALLPKSPGFASSLAAVRRLSDNSCRSWTEWLTRVSGEQKWPDAAEIARDLGATWQVTELTHATTAASAADYLIAGIDGVNRHELRAVLDLLCQVARQLVASPAAGRFIDAVLLVLAEDENPSVPVRAAFFDLVMDVLDSGPSGDRYKDMLVTTQSLWSRVRSREAMPWILDVLDGLASHSVPSESARQALVSAVATSSYEFVSRLRRDERVLLEAICRECRVPIALPPMEGQQATETTDVWKGLSGKLIGIYSLIEGMGTRLRDRLALLCNTVQVEQNSDTVATEALRALAVRANFLIVDTKHAAHAATAAIDSVRPRDQQLFPAGGGMSSFIARLRDSLAG